MIGGAAYAPNAPMRTDILAGYRPGLPGAWQGRFAPWHPGSGSPPISTMGGGSSPLAAVGNTLAPIAMPGGGSAGAAPATMPGVGTPPTGVMPPIGNNLAFQNQPPFSGGTAGGGQFMFPPNLNFPPGSAPSGPPSMLPPSVLPPQAPPSAPPSGVTPPVGSGGPTPAMIGAPPTPEAYSQALQASFSPYFQQSQNDLAAREASMGILHSGAANKDFQDLTARNNATFANALAPLIQQGFGQQFQANEGNANAYNQVLAQMLGINANAQQTNAQLGLQGQEFNANLINQALLQNNDIANQFALARAQFGNSDYLNALGQMGGFMGTGLSGLGYVLGQGMQNQFNGYTNGYQSMLPYIQQLGQSQGYQTPPGWNGTTTIPGVPGNWQIPTGTYQGDPTIPLPTGTVTDPGPTSGSQLPPPDNSVSGDPGTGA
jgi:hypothetical protein